MNAQKTISTKGLTIIFNKNLKVVSLKGDNKLLIYDEKVRFKKAQDLNVKNT